MGSKVKIQTKEGTMELSENDWQHCFEQWKNCGGYIEGDKIVIGWRQLKNK